MGTKEGEKIRCGVAGVGYLGQHHARIYNLLIPANLREFMIQTQVRGVR